MAESEEEYDEFEEQLKLERQEKERRSRCSDIEHGSTRTDPDGTVYEWDADKMAYFPKIDANFIAQYQMGYGNYEEPKKEPDTTKTAKPDSATGESTTDWSQYFSYVMKYSAEHGKYPPEMTKSHIEYYNYLYKYYYGDNKSDDAQTKTAKDDESDPKDSDKKGDNSEVDKDSKDTNSEKKGCSQTENKTTEGEAEDEKEKADIGSSVAGREETEQEKAYREYYEYYQNYQQSGEGHAESSEDKEQKEFDEWAYYNYYYGSEEQEENKEGQEADKKDEASTEEVPEKKKRKADEQGWFEIDDARNTNVYVTGLPHDVTDEEFRELMGKCGMITFDPRTREPKVKLYRDAEGKPKGDGLCCYIKSESVGLALQMLDEYDVRGYKISVEVAKFEMKGRFDPKKRKKLSSKDKKNIRKQHEKMFDWRPDKPKGYRPKHERIIVIKNAFDPAVFEKDPKKIQTLREDLRAQCTNFGTVKKVIVYDRHEEGVVTVAFLDVAEADLARESLHGRFFQRRQITAEAWDGNTKYEVKETDAEREARLSQWGTYLEEGDKGVAPAAGKPALPDDKKEKTSEGPKETPKDTPITTTSQDSGQGPQAGTETRVGSSQEAHDTCKTMGEETTVTTKEIEDADKDSTPFKSPPIPKEGDSSVDTKDEDVTQEPMES